MTLASLPARHKERCEAITGVRRMDYGFEPLRCHQRRGLRLVDGHAYCAAPGHRERVIAQARRGA